VLPTSAPKLRQGRTRAIFGASDFQEAKNVTTFGPNLMPNTRFRGVKIKVVRGTTVTWLLPRRRGCLRGNQGLLVVANTTNSVRAVSFFDGKRRVATDRTGVSGLYAATWRARSARKGRHRLRAVAISARGRDAVASRVVRVCR
jgi:hypothetical protein